jgi:hypothetical protein
MSLYIKTKHLKENLEHTVIALVIQVILAALFNNWYIGAILASGIFIGREYAQAEYRWIAKYGKGLRENMRWDDPLDPEVWNFHNFFWNLVLPIICVSIMVIITL